jgi:hypothetical protein
MRVKSECRVNLAQTQLRKFPDLVTPESMLLDKRWNSIKLLALQDDILTIRDVRDFKKNTREYRTKTWTVKATKVH